MSFNLTTVARYKAYAGITGTAYDALLTTMIPAVSQQIARYFRCDLVETTYYSWLNGNGAGTLLIPNWPVTAVYQVCVRYNSAATIYHDDDGTVTIANVLFDGTNLILNSFSTAGVVTNTSLAIATYKTLTTLKTQIETSSGWHMDITSGYENYPTAIVRPIAAANCISPDEAEIQTPGLPEAVRVISDCEITLVSAMQYPASLDYGMGYGVPVGMITHGLGYGFGYEMPLIEGGFPRGLSNVYVNYKAGYTMPTDLTDGTLPAGMELVAQQIIKDVFASRSLNSMLRSESLGDYSYSLGDITSAIQQRRKDLNQYRRVVLA